MHSQKTAALVVAVLMVLTMILSIQMAISSTAPRNVIASSAQRMDMFAAEDGSNGTTNVSDTPENPQSIDAAQKQSTLMTILVIVGMSGFAVLVVIGGIKYIGRDNVLDTPVRASIYKYVQDNPGAHLRQICSDLDINVTNATWHLRKLEETHYVTKKKEGKFLKYYPLERKVEGNPRDFN
ncbi:MAG: helix-turn-helix domain-containing protein [Candidatus Thermoplasmatota archaeon]|nr:helix-turn-helix domain-containing protein [Candidatus Thermoplasmatota archaeon]